MPGPASATNQKRNSVPQVPGSGTWDAQQ